MTEKELGEKIDQAFLKYKKVRENHMDLRKQFIESLAEAIAKDGDKKKATVIKELIEREGQRELFRKLAFINKKNQNLSTTFVIVRSGEGEEQDLTEKEAMEDAIIEENRKKYHQTEKTCPFKKYPLRQYFGEAGKGPVTDRLLEGKYSPTEDQSPQTRSFLENCNSQGVPITKMERTFEEYTRSWEKMDERTASRDLHFGHFKAATKCDTNALIHYALAEIPFRTGYSPTRWKEATNLMILKKEGVHQVDKLRTIVLYEADFNHNNKFFGKK